MLEKSVSGFVTASWSVYQYLEGQPCTCAEADRIAAMLRKLHQTRINSPRSARQNLLHVATTFG